MLHIKGFPDLEELAIPDRDVVAGTPRAQVATLYELPGGAGSVGVFRCSTGTFRYTLEAPELTHLLEGEMVIHVDGQAPLHAKAGDTFVLEGETSMVVEVLNPISDLFVSWTARPDAEHASSDEVAHE